MGLLKKYVFVRQTVIPAELVPVCFKRGAGIQFIKTGFRVKPGMTVKVKGLMTHYNSKRESAKV